MIKLIRSCYCSVAKLCLTLCNPMDCNTPGVPILHYLPEFVQTHVHCIGDTIQPSHSLSSPSPPAFSLSQHQGLFQRVSSSYQVAKVLEIQPQHHSFQRNPRVDLLQNGLVGSPCSPRDSQESSPTPQFKSINSLALSFIVQLSHPYTTTGKTIALTRQNFIGKVMSLLFNMLPSRVIQHLSFCDRQISHGVLPLRFTYVVQQNSFHFL